MMDELKSRTGATTINKSVLRDEEGLPELKPTNRSLSATPKQKTLPLTSKNLEKLKNIQEPSVPLKKEKPAWAMTENEIKEKKENEESDLLNFMQDLDYDKYLEDLEVRVLLSNLKDRIDHIEGSTEEKDRVQKAIHQRAQMKLKQKNVSFDPNPKEEDLDRASEVSYNGSHAGSVSSSKTQETIQGLKEKMNQEKDWDKSSVIKPKPFTIFA